MASPALNFITFNQDHSCLAVGMSMLLFFLLLLLLLWLPSELPI